jgi:hypothetical protein
VSTLVSRGTCRATATHSVPQWLGRSLRRAALEAVMPPALPPCSGPCLVCTLPSRIRARHTRGMVWREGGNQLGHAAVSIKKSLLFTLQVWPHHHPTSCDVKYIDIIEATICFAHSAEVVWMSIYSADCRSGMGDRRPGLAIGGQDAGRRPLVTRNNLQQSSRIEEESRSHRSVSR